MFNSKSMRILVSLLAIATSAVAASGDPTRPGRSYKGTYAQKPASANYKVSAIFVNGERPQAIVNNRLVSEGDRFSDAVVKKITKQSVVLNQQKDGNWQSITLTVGKASSNKFSIRSADKF